MTRLSRADYLKITGLPEDIPFSLAPDRNPQDGRWMVRVSAEGRADFLIARGVLERHLDLIRETAPDLANQIAGCLEHLDRRARAG